MIKMCERSLEDVRSLIMHAKLDESKLTYTTQVLDYSSCNEDFHSYKLLQLDSHLMQQLKEGIEVSFKGGKTEEAVLCTDFQTYEIKEAETSNSLLIIPGLLWPKESNLNESLDKSLEDEEINESSTITINNECQSEVLPLRSIQKQSINRILHTYYEIHQIQPKFRKLFELLQLTRYSGPEHEYAIDKKFLFTSCQLLSTVQSSHKELLDGFREIHALQIDNYIRILDIEYEFRVISYMLQIIEENSWNFSQVSKNITVESLKDIVPHCVLEGLFNIYTTHLEDDQYSYNVELISRLFAQTILKSSSKFNLDDFLMTWQAAMPEGMKTDKSHLEGIALIDTEATPPCIKALDNYTLPSTLFERFQTLFKIKKMWTLDQLRPYVKCFTTPNLSITTLVSKYCRASKVDGIRMYGPKHSN